MRLLGGITVVPDPGLSTKPAWRTRGSLETVKVRGATTQLHATTRVSLPPEYFQPGYAHTEFPAVEAGYPGASGQLTQPREITQPPEITRHYRVQPDGWCTLGDSTGGYCAAKITLMNPYVFHAAASLSGYVTPLHDRTTGSPWGVAR